MDQLRAAARSLERHLDQLGTVASARRRGEELVTLSVGAHSVGLERVLALAPEVGSLERDPHINEVVWVHRPQPPETELLDGVTERIERILEAVGQTGVPGLDEAALGLLDDVSDIYGSALARAFEILHRDGHGDVIHAALDDPAISEALVLHGLHPDDVATRAGRALAEVAATFTPSGPRVAFEGIDLDGTVRLRVTGDPVRDRWRVALAAERAVRAATPDATDVVVDGVEDETPAEGVQVFIPLSAIGRKRPDRPRRWVELPRLRELAPGGVLALTHEDLHLIACRVGTDYYVALDPFADDDHHDLTITADTPPSVRSAKGTTFAFAEPFPVQRDGDLIEVAVP